MGRIDDFEDDVTQYVGFDFGTAYSIIAVKRSGQNVEAIRPEGAEYHNGIPSLFWKRPEDRFKNLPLEMTCADVVLNNGIEEDPDGVVSSVKMRLKEENISLHGRVYSPEDIAERIVRKIKDLTNYELVEMEGYPPLPEKMVVGVPVVFNSRERTAIRDVMRNCGIEAALIAEPIAAALYYANQRKRGFSRVLVMDFGAGTFDVTLLSKNENPSNINPYPYTVEGQDGSKYAGDCFDNCMVELIIDKLESGSFPGFQVAPIKDKGNRDHIRLIKIARDAKEKLSKVEDSAINIAGLDAGYAQVRITRSEYEERIKPFILRNIDIARKVMSEAKAYGNGDLEVLLVGGSSFIPLIRQLFQKEMETWLSSDRIHQRSPELAVAYGCALFAEMPKAAAKVNYGFAVDTHFKGENVLHVIVPANIELPYKTKTYYRTRIEGQEDMCFNVYEVPNAIANGHVGMDEGKAVGYTIKHQFGKKVKKGTNVTLTTELDSSGILHFDVDGSDEDDDSHTSVEYNAGSEMGRGKDGKR